MPSSYIIAGCRTPIGKFQGSLAALPATRLGAACIAEALRRANLPGAEVDEVIMGQVLTAGVGQAPARQAALNAGLPPTVPALTVNKVCGSGLKAVMLADQAIRCGDAEAIVAGGMESMSRAPYVLPGVREGWKFGNQTVVDSMQHDGLWCACENVGMGVHADYTATSRGVSRADQDLFAAQSHRRAIAAIAAGTFDEEIVPITVPGPKGETIVARDEGPRPESTIEKLAALRAAFSAEGSVTAGNASQISDGAAAVVVVSEAFANRSTARAKYRIVASATSGGPPKELFTAPIAAMQQALRKADLTMADIDLVELNEAFAAQCLACMHPLDLHPDKVNVEGGAIALGHPIGASGARILVTLMHSLARRRQRLGLASLCLGGGNAVAMIIEHRTS